MKRRLIFGFILLTSIARPNYAQQTYRPPEVASAGDVYVPYEVLIDGLFVLDVSIDEQGQIQKIDALRDPGAMLGAAKQSIYQWKFQPASKDGKSVLSRMTISFVYHPVNNGNVVAVPPRDFRPVLPPSKRSGVNASGDYVPVGVLSFEYPIYPANAVAWGSVVVQLTVDSSGDVRTVAFLHGMEGFNQLVSNALAKWRFQPATFNGKPIASKTIIAFTFQPPSSN